MMPRYQEENNKIFIGGLPVGVTYQEITRIFQTCGIIKRIWISPPPRLPCFAFIVFENAEDAIYAVHELNGIFIRGMKIHVRPYIKKVQVVTPRVQFQPPIIEQVRFRPVAPRVHLQPLAPRVHHQPPHVEQDLNFEPFSSIILFFQNNLFSFISFTIRKVITVSSFIFNLYQCLTYNENVDYPYHSLDESVKSNEVIECLVCFDKVSINNIIYCNIPFFKNEDILMNFDNLENKQSSSKCIYEELKELDNKENSDPEVHAFCLNCIRGSASAAVEDIPLAKGGIGLRCMMTDCENPIPYSEIRKILSNDLQKKLDERILQESIGMAIDNLERCKNCNFAFEIEYDKNINKVFHCPNCDVKMCRLCERNWDDEHFGLSCEELDAKEKKDKRDRALENKLNEAIIRKCPRCGIAFMKEKGCNKMTCRCGMTQCYICRQTGIDYKHYCKCFIDPNVFARQNKCKYCKKTCLLHEDEKIKDEQLIKKIRLEAGQAGDEHLIEPNDIDDTNIDYNLFGSRRLYRWIFAN